MTAVLLLMYRKGASEVVYVGCDGRMEGEALYRLLAMDPTVPKPERVTVSPLPKFSLTIVGRKGATLTALNVASLRQAMTNAALEITTAPSAPARLPAPRLAVQPEFTASWDHKNRTWVTTETRPMTSGDLAGMKPFQAGKVKSALMFMHCADGNVPAVQELIEAHGVSANITLPHGATALFIAVEYGRTDVIELLLKHGADIDQPNTSGDSPICCSVDKGQLAMCNLLLSHGANPNATQSNTIPPLLRAVHKNQVEIARALINAGARRDVPLVDGTTLLQYAKNAKEPDPLMVNLFL